MASYDGSVRINTKFDTSNFNAGVKGMLSSLKGIAGAVGVAFSVAAVVKFGKECVDIASDIQEVQNVVDTAFGDMAYKMEEFADTAIEQFGISKLAAKQTGSTFMAMARGMGLAVGNASDMAIALTGLSADMSSFYNVSQDIASTALKSIFTGETETLKQFGVVMTETNLQEFAYTQGIQKKISAMTQAEKVQLRYNYVMAQTALAQGDFAKTSGSWANQTRILSEQWREFMSILGTGLVTVLTPVIQGLNRIISALITFANAIGAVLSKVFGIKAQALSVASGAEAMAGGYEDAAGAADDYAGAAGDAADATKKAAKAAKSGLSSLDEFNNLSSQKNSGSGGSGGGAGSPNGSEIISKPLEAGESALDGISKKFQDLIDFIDEVKDAIVDGFTDAWKVLDISSQIDMLKNSFISIGNTIKEIFSDPEVVDGFKNMVLAWANTLGTLTASMLSIGLSIANGLVGGIAQGLEAEKEHIKTFLKDMFQISIDVAGIVGQFSLAIAEIAKVFQGDAFKGIVANLTGTFIEAFTGIVELAAKFGRDVINIISKPIIDNADKLETAFDNLFKPIESVLGTLKDAVTDTFDGINKMYDAHLKPLFDSIGNGISSILSTFLDFWNGNVSPILDNMAKDIDDIVKSHVQPMINTAIGLIGDLADLIKALWENVLVPVVNWIIQNILPKLLPIIQSLWSTVSQFIANVSDVINGLLEILRGVITFLTGVFSGDWSKAWEGIKTIAKGVWDTIKSLIKTAIDAIKGVINTVMASIKAVWDTAWTAIKTVVSTIWTAIKKVVSDAVDAVKKGISDKIGKIKSDWNTVWGAIKDKVTKVFDGIKSKITGVMSSVKSGISSAVNGIKSTWNKAFDSIKSKTSSVFNGIWSVIKKICNSILGGIESMVNGVINGFNKMIGALNKFKVDIPDWVPAIGGNSLGFNISTIGSVKLPRLAKGGITTGRTLAEIGEAGREAVLPLQNNTGWMDDLAEKLASKMGNGNVTFQIEGDPNGMFKIIQKEARNYTNRTGNEAFSY